MTTIGFIGLGNMGGPMAANLVKAGHDVSGFDVVPAAIGKAAAAGIGRAPDPAAAVAGAAVIITMLPAGEHVRKAYAGRAGILETAGADALLIDCSTIDVDTARLVHKQAAERGFAMVDAPVSGGVTGAENAALTFMVGGAEAA